MYRHLRRLMAVACVVASAGQVVAQTDTPENNQPADTAYVGELTGNAVYVRSGPSSNHYPVAKLDAGVKVRVHRVVNGWCEVDPPSGCFSLIHKNFVDIGVNGSSSVVNGQNVLVRAGSSLTADLYARQLKLNRGDEVRVLGPHNDDYLRIEPPKGARLYVNEQFIQRVADMLSEAPLNPPAFTGSEPTPKKQNSEIKTTENPTATDEGESSPSTSPTPTPKEQTDVADHTGLSVMEASLAEELEKPVEHRDYDRLIEGFKKIAEDDGHERARAIAGSRIIQLEHAVKAQRSLLKLRDLSDELSAERNEAMRERTLIKPPPRPIGGGFDAVGELRVSMLYGTSSSPKRYRLVSTGDKPRTIGYVEIPADLQIDMQTYLGRRVGVRARDRRLQTGDVDPVVIYIVQELVVLDSTDLP